MKKSIIALAVAGAMTVPMVAQADATLFGSVRYDITDTDGTDHTNSEINRMRIGVKGEETMDNGLTAGYFIRMEAGSGSTTAHDADNAFAHSTATHEATNDSSVGISKIALYIAGDFGKLILGDEDNPVARTEGEADLTSVYDGSLEVAGPEFTEGGITYQSNEINGFTFRIGAGDVDGGDATATAGENQYGTSLSYSNDLVNVTAGFGESGDDSISGIGALVKLGDLKIGAAFSDKENDASYYSVSTSYTMDKLTLAAQLEVQDPDAAGSEDQKAVNVSASYSLGGNATVTLGALDFDRDAEAAGENDAVKLRYAISF
jgi:hypothetical protein